MFFESMLDYGWLCWCTTSEVWMQAIITTKYEFVIQILESGCCQCASMTVYYHVWACRTNVVPLSNGVSTHELYLCKAIYWTNHGDCEGSSTRTVFKQVQ